MSTTERDAAGLRRKDPPQQVRHEPRRTGKRFRDLFKVELDQVGEPTARFVTAGEDQEEPRIAQISANLVGLALSGGGIRSATFNLGLLQGLAKQGLLKHFHYLATVSGGGIHRWMVDGVSEEATRARASHQSGSPCLPGSRS